MVLPVYMRLYFALIMARSKAWHWEKCFITGGSLVFWPTFSFSLYFCSYFYFITSFSSLVLDLYVVLATSNNHAAHSLLSFMLRSCCSSAKWASGAVNNTMDMWKCKKEAFSISCLFHMRKDWLSLCVHGGHRQFLHHGNFQALECMEHSLWSHKGLVLLICDIYLRN